MHLPFLPPSLLPSSTEKCSESKLCPELPLPSPFRLGKGNRLLLLPPWDAEIQKGERRAQPGAAGADLEEWGCSGDESLQITCRKDRVHTHVLGVTWKKVQASVEWSLKGKGGKSSSSTGSKSLWFYASWNNKCKVFFNSPSHICGCR